MKRSIAISSETKNLDILRSFLRDILIDNGIDLVFFNKIFLGLSEAVCNSIIHGNGHSSEKRVFITFACSSDNLVIEVKDEGKGFNFNVLENPTKIDNLRKESGRGIYILKSIADDVSYFENGSKVVIKYIF